MRNRGRSVILVLFMLTVLMINIAATPASANKITLVEGDKTVNYETKAENVEELLEQLKVDLGEMDTVEPALDTEITDDMIITIKRWKPTVSIDINGNVQTETTDALNVEELLDSLGITLTDGDEIQPSKLTTITEGLKITIKTKEVKTETEERPMGYSKKVVAAQDVPYGMTKVAQQGKNGIKHVTLQRTYFGGEIVDEEVLDVVVEVKPIDEIIHKGVPKHQTLEVMNRIDKAVNAASEKYDVDKDMILAIIEHESCFKPNVSSYAGAQGLMQVLPSNFHHLGIKDGYNIEQNINGGTYLLRKCMDLFDGDLKMGLTAYAVGEGTMRRYGVKSFDDIYKMPYGTREAIIEIVEMYEDRKSAVNAINAADAA